MTALGRAGAVAGSAAKLSPQEDEAPRRGSQEVLGRCRLCFVEHTAAAVAKPKRVVAADVLELPQVLPAVMAACCQVTQKSTVDRSCRGPCCHN